MALACYISTSLKVQGEGQKDMFKYQVHVFRSKMDNIMRNKFSFYLPYYKLCQFLFIIVYVPTVIHSLYAFMK